MAGYEYKPSLLEGTKLGTLQAKKEQKTQRLQSGRERDFIQEDPGLFDNVLSLGQSSTLMEGGLDADALKNISNYVLDTNLDSSENTGYSNQAIADQVAGVDPRVRQNLQEGQHQVVVDLAKREYLKAALDSAKVAIPTAADSGGSLLGMAAGLLTSKGVGAVLSTKRKFDKLQGAVEEFKTIRKIVDAGGKLGKAIAVTAPITISETQRKVHSYQAAHNGELPSAERVAVMTIGSAITNSIELGIVKKLFLPEGKQVMKGVKELVRTMKPNSSAIVSISKRLGKGLLQVGEAAGAEGVQEYLQTWDEILSVKVNPKTGETLFSSILKELSNKDNRIEALAGGYLGAAAGGATKLALTAPSIGVGSSIDATVGTAKTAYKTTAKVASTVYNRSARKNLSEEDKRDLHTEFKNQQEIVKQKTQDLKEQTSFVKKASSIDELKSNPEVAKVVEKLQTPKLTDEALADPKVFKEFKKAVIQANKNAQTIINDNSKKSNLAHFSSRTGKPDKGVTTLATQEQTDTLVSSVTPHGEDVVNAAKGIETSAAIDLINRVSKDSTELTKGMRKQANELSVHDLERVAAIVQATNPEVAKTFQTLAKKKDNAFNRFTPAKTRIIDENNIAAELTDVAESGITNESRIPAISAALSSTMHKKVNSVAAVKVLQKTISEYEKTKAFSKQGKGVVKERTIAKWKKRLANLERELKDKELKNPKKESTKTKDAEKPTKSSKEPSKETPKKEAPDVDTSSTTDAQTAVIQGLKKISAFVAIANDAKDDLTPIVEELSGIALKIAEAGYNTKESFDKLMESFPEITKTPEVLNALSLATYNPNVEESPVVTNELEQSKLVATYKKLFPGCKL